MTIRFKCPNAKCQKVLVVKDELAGKRAKCPICKQSVSIPAPVSAPAPADLEAFAAAAFAADTAEKKAAAAAPPPETRTIDFTCNYCDAELHLPAEMGGKQVPCPECKRIIKVPRLKEDRPKDWRQVEKAGPAFARRDEPEKPHGAWEAGRSKVSQEALEEAGVITEEAEPRTFWEKVRVPVYVGAGVLAVVLLWVVYSKFLSRSAQKRALDAALAFVESKENKAKLAPALVADVYRGAGEFHLRARQAEPARKSFGSARALPPSGKDALDRDLVLTRVAVAQVGLGGTDDEYRGKERLEWGDANKEVFQTLRAINSPEALAAALREVAHGLLRQKQQGGAVGLATRLRTKAEDVPLTAQLIALLRAANRDKDADTELQALAPKDDKKPDPKQKQKNAELGKVEKQVRWLASVEGKALQGNFDEARREARKGESPSDRLQALLAVGEWALLQGKTEEAKTAAEEILAGEGALKPEAQKGDELFLVRVCRLAARAGLTDKAKTLADGLADKSARGWAHFYLLGVELEGLAKGGTAANTNLVDERLKDKDTVAYGLALEEVARHNARLGQESAVQEWAERLDERLRPLVQIGVALGIQDSLK
jgi:hypothetical protein